jgi:hypothetical protein
MSIGNIATSPPDRTPGNTTRTRRTPLWVMYLLAVIIPIIGLIFAIQLAVMERYRDVRRHAIGVAATSIGVLIIWLVATGAFSSSHSDNNVASALQHLLTTHGVVVTGKPICVHQSGNTYTCRVKTHGTTTLGQVTDDGKAIAWQPTS